MCIHCTNAGVFDAKKAIKTAIEDYRRHTTAVEVLDDISDEFINRLARDSYSAKTELRNLFSKSPNWNEELQAIALNGSYKHEPDYHLIRRLIYDAIYRFSDTIGNEKWNKVVESVRFFCQLPTTKVAGLSVP